MYFLSTVIFFSLHFDYKKILREITVTYIIKKSIKKFLTKKNYENTDIYKTIANIY